MLSRRELLQLSAASLASIIAFRLNSNCWAAESKGMTLGFSLYGMRRLAITDALDACAQIGYQAVELPVMADWPGDPQQLTKEHRSEIRTRLASLKLGLPALMENLPLDVDENRHLAQLERLKRAAELAHELNRNHPPLIETILGGKEGQWQELRNQFRDRLGQWEAIGRQTETLVCIKPHRLGAMNRPEQAAWLMQQIGSRWLQLAYDYSHFQHREMTIPDTIRQMTPHIRFVHIKDTRIENGKVRFVLPGDGSVDYSELIAALRAIHYSGCVCVEVSGMVQNQPDYDPIKAAQRSYQSVIMHLASGGR